MTENGSFSPRESRKSGRSKPNQGIVDALAAVLEPGCTVMDCGAGEGHYVKWLRGNGHNAVGVDGTEGISEATGGLVDHLDLTQPESFSAGEIQADAAICIEVGEHIPKKLESVFLDNVANSAMHQLFISWALPDQPGRGHVNCRTTEWVTSEIVKRGWELDEEKTLKARLTVGGGGAFAAKKKLLVFRKQPKQK